MIQINEPARTSVLDVVQRNLRAAGCKTYVTRVVYVGQYHGTHEALRKKMEDIIHELRMDHSDMPITGLFLVYPTCYVHVLEAWEDIIYKHYERMYAMQSSDCKFGKAIPLPSYHNAYQRFFTGWYHFYTVPPTLLAMLEDHTLAGIQKHALDCLIKVYRLCEYISNAMREKPNSIQQVLHRLETPRGAHYLPESTILEFLLDVKSPVLHTVQEYLLIYSDVSPSAFWDDNNVWPPPCSIMPRDVFDEHGRRKVADNGN